MSKYDNYINYEENLESPLVPGEKVIWSAKPKKSAFIINNIVTMLPFALIWMLFDLMFIIPMVCSGEIMQILFFVIPFFALHLIPVWIWLAKCITASKKWKNTKYYVTDKRIIIQTGIIGASYQTIYYKDIRNVELRIGIIDKMLGVGDIYISTGNIIGLGNTTRVGNNNLRNVILDIENPYEIYPKLQKIVLDIQTDIEYPNAYRPSENNGYNTKYNG